MNKQSCTYSTLFFILNKCINIQQYCHNVNHLFRFRSDTAAGIQQKLANLNRRPESKSYFMNNIFGNQYISHCSVLQINVTAILLFNAYYYNTSNKISVRVFPNYTDFCLSELSSLHNVDTLQLHRSNNLKQGRLALSLNVLNIEINIFMAYNPTNCV